MAESVDALVSNTSGFTSMPVRPRLRAPTANPRRSMEHITSRQNAHLKLARKLAAAAKGETIERRNVDIKKTTERFIARVSSEVERMLDYKQKDFEAALAKIPAKDLKDFRSSLALLLDAVDAAGKRRE